MTSIGMRDVRGGVQLRADPARDPHLKVVHDQADMAHEEYGSLEWKREMLHTEVNDEIQSLEIAAQSLADFADAPWSIRMKLARQGWDEVRHARLFLRRLIELGGHFGEFPIINQEWGVVCSFDSLPARLAVQNRVFEGGSLDVLKEGVEFYAERGDTETSMVNDAVAADEVDHVAYANAWLEGLRTTSPTQLMQAMAAMDRLRTIAVALRPEGDEPDHEIAVNVEDRRRAGFTGTL